MTIILGMLLALAIAGLAFVGFYAFQLRLRNADLSADLDEQITRYETECKQAKEESVALSTKHETFVSKCQEEVKKWREYSKSLKAEVERLSKWQSVADADARATEILRSARDQLSKAAADASSLLIDAQQKASAELASARETATAIAQEAKEKAKSQKDEAQYLLGTATTSAAKLIEDAEKKALEIAGSAYEAKKNADLYERTVKAMKNIIEGIGDQYIIPEQSLLDDLAEDFSHKQAGQELKRARDCTKVMIRNGTAADCEYVEANRRETAIHFVADAFNGKVDSILSRVKHDNVGKLEQQIRDAFTLVNFNGKAFRDARITEGYLGARLEELKWASIVQQLSLQEREEQRYVKEQAREEARAMKEQQRALREAAKEEEMLQKAILQAQEQYEQASDEQREMYEERLREMGERLKQALERKERARSMAEQTKRGHVYIISNTGSFGDEVYKIGLTRRDDPHDRVRELGDSSVPFDFDVHAMILSDDAPALEYQLHKHFLLRQMNKVNHRKEFFRVSLKEIREEIEKLGLTTGVHWTMTSEAKDYRETLAIEKAIKNDPSMREKWIKRQLAMELIASETPEADSGSEEDE